MHQVIIGSWALTIEVGSLPLSYDWFVDRALLVEEIDLKSKEGRPFFVAVYALDKAQRDPQQPLVTVAQIYLPYQAGFYPGVLIVPETARLFIGAGTRLLSYDLDAPARAWEDEADCGFWRWGRNRDYVWMEAELEFAVWSTTGKKLWTTFVEPPWHASVVAGEVELDVMGKKEARRMSDGLVVR